MKTNYILILITLWLSLFAIILVNSDRVLSMRGSLFNVVRWYGIRVPQTTESWGDPNSMVPYTAYSGNNDWGPAVQILGSADTLTPGALTGDANEVMIMSSSENTLYRCRFIWSSSTLQEGLNKNQWTEFVYIKTNSDHSAQTKSVSSPQVSATDRVWFQCRNVTNNASISFVASVRTYD